MDNKRLEELLDTIITNKMILDKAGEEFNNAVHELDNNWTLINLENIDESLNTKINTAKKVLDDMCALIKDYDAQLLGEGSDRGRVN